MAMQVKHMVTFGLGLGIATAFGYHFLSSPGNNVDSLRAKHVTPLDRFEIAQPPTLTVPTPVPTQPQIDDHFRVEALPLQSPTAQAISPVQSKTPKYSYKELVAEMQPTLSAAAESVQQDIESDELDSFSLDLSGPGDNVPEFGFDDSALHVDTQPTESTLPAEVSLDDTSEAVELDMVLGNQTTEQILADDSTFEASSAQTVATQSQDESFAVVVDYNSQSIDRLNNAAEQKTQTSKKSWKSNPFIGGSQEANASVTTADPTPVSSLQMPQAREPQKAPTAMIQRVAPAQAGSVVSLNDPTRTHSAVVIPDMVQPNQHRAAERVANRSVEVAPEPLLSLSDAAAQKAVHHIEYGKTLSRRGAAFTARQEFLAAMQVIAASNDNASGNNRYSKALAMAMLTIKEANDFSVSNSEQQIQMDVASVVEAHRSQVLSPAQAANLSPVQAMNRYFARAQQQLDFAGGRNVVTAEVFYCLGKLHTMLNRNEKVLGPYETAKSVVYHQAALLSDDQHHRSANELGVLLARSGRLEQSKLLFERSLISQPTIRTWQNLAETHRRLGETNYATQASAEMQVLANEQVSAAHSGILWKPVEVFNADAPVEFNKHRVARLPSVPQQQPIATPDKPSPAKAFAEKLKGIF